MDFRAFARLKVHDGAARCMSVVGSDHDALDSPQSLAIAAANTFRHVEVGLTKAVGIRRDTGDGEPALQIEGKRMPAAILKTSEMRDWIRIEVNTGERGQPGLVIAAQDERHRAALSDDSLEICDEGTANTSSLM
jgi:hypothetical protein